MKNWKNICLTALALLMLVGFAWAVASPTITVEARARHMDMAAPLETEEDADDAYDFL